MACSFAMRSLGMPLPPKFAVDEMLGSLARWLRIMGYDATYEKDHDDDSILRISKDEGRVILTRDEELAARGAPTSVFISSDDLAAPSSIWSSVSSCSSSAIHDARMRCHSPGFQVTTETV